MFVRKLLEVGVVIFTHNRLFFGEYTYTFVVHMVYDILVVDMIVYDMQMWCGYVLSKVPLKFMTSRTVFAMCVCVCVMICMDMDNFLLLKRNI